MHCHLQDFQINLHFKFVCSLKVPTSIRKKGIRRSKLFLHTVVQSSDRRSLNIQGPPKRFFLVCVITHRAEWGITQPRKNLFGGSCTLGTSSTSSVGRDSRDTANNDTDDKITTKTKVCSFTQMARICQKTLSIYFIWAHRRRRPWSGSYPRGHQQMRKKMKSISNIGTSKASMTIMHPSPVSPHR